jgi:hypothetical protein
MRTDVLMKKTEGQKSCDAVPLSLKKSSNSVGVKEAEFYVNFEYLTLR